jgi:outer membrane lipoprotein-sorting protein
MKKYLPIILCLIAAPAFAGDWKNKDVSAVEAYLTNISSIVADFNQVSPDGSLATGKFYLKRPGKMRWQYNPPTPILLVSNGKTVTYFDAELDQVNYIPIDDTLAGFLTQKLIRLDSKATMLVDFQKQGGVIRASVIQRDKPDEGTLTLELNANPLQLKQLKISDATGGVTSVQFQNAAFGPVIDDKLFVFIDPRGVTPRKRR